MSMSKSLQATQAAVAKQPSSDGHMPARSGRMRHWITFGLSLALSAVVLYFIFQRVDGRLLRQLLEKQSHGLLIAAALFIFLQIIFGGERWRAILSALTRDRRLPAFSVQAVYYASIFFNRSEERRVGKEC